MRPTEQKVQPRGIVAAILWVFVFASISSSNISNNNRSSSPSFLFANAESILFESFEGTVGDKKSSWFEATKWKGVNRIPTMEDVVWIDESNTYVAIDKKLETAEVGNLVVGRSSASDPLTSVQLDMLWGTKLTVGSDMSIGVFAASDGTVYAQDGARIDVGGKLSVGSDEGGNGVLVLMGASKVTAKNLKIGKNSNGGSRILMDDASVLRINGNRVAAVGKMIDGGLIVASSATKVGAPAKKFLIERKAGRTVVKLVDGNDDETNPPTACEDRALRYKKKKKKNCTWVGKRKGRRCKLIWKEESLKEWCPVACKVCTPENNDDNDGTCKDDTDLQYKDDSSKNCGWVADKLTNNRCKRAWKGTTIATFCPKTCGTC